MSQESFFNNLTDAVSNERFDPYRKSFQQDELPAWEHYLWNVSLCESLYPALNCIEIVLRNGIHDAAIVNFGTTSWFKGHLKEPENERLETLSRKLQRSGVTSPTTGDLVAGLTSGFWVDLLKGRYEQILWPALLPVVFPYATKRQRSRERVYQRLARIQTLRNRVFHHEPIWHLQDPEEQHESILETIGWMSPAMLAVTRMLDRFDSVYTRGAHSYANELESIAQNWGAQ